MEDATAQLPATSSPRNSQQGSNATENLAQLMDWLQDLMVSVKVSNPIARRDPDTAITVMAERLLKYPPNVVRAELEKWPLRNDATWPTVGELVGQIDHVIGMARKNREAARKSAEERHHQDIVTSAFQRRVLESDLGQQALGEGWGASLLHDLRERTIQWPKDVTLEYMQRRRRATGEVRGYAAKDPEGKSGFDRALISLARTMIANNDDLARQHVRK